MELRIMPPPEPFRKIFDAEEERDRPLEQMTFIAPMRRRLFAPEEIQLELNRTALVEVEARAVTRNLHKLAGRKTYGVVRN